MLGWGGTGALTDRASASMTGGDAIDRAHFAGVLAVAGLSEVAEADLAIVVHPASEWQGVVAACAPGLPESDEAHYLRVVVPEAGGIAIDLFAPGEPGRRMAWQTIRQIALGVPLPSSRVAIADAPATAMRGVIETFYGPPWRPEDRRRGSL